MKRHLIAAALVVFTGIVIDAAFRAFGHAPQHFSAESIRGALGMAASVLVCSFLFREPR